MKFKYIGDSMISLKTPCPVTGQLVDLHTGDTIDLDWKPGGHPQTLVLVKEEVVEEVVAPIPKPKRILLSKKPKSK